MTDTSEIEQLLSARAPEADACGRLAVGTVLDGWKVVAFVGAGRSAEVYRVINRRIGGEAALKLLIDDSSGLLDRFRLEMDVLQALTIPALPRFLGGGIAEGKPYYVMEYLQPLILPLPRAEIVPFMTKLAASVESLHAAGYVHRDIKPANILRRRSGEPVLIDLGLVRRIDDKTIGTTVSDGLSLVGGKQLGVGTPDFAAPEQLIKGDATVRSDVFALGKMLKACGGKTLGVAARRVIRRATAEDPEDRYPTVAAFSAALRSSVRSQFKTAACAVGAVLVAASLVIAFFVARQDAAPPMPVPPVARPPQKITLPGEDLEAIVKEAEAHFHGRSTPTNLTEAARLYAIAAKSGHPGAQLSLGNCLLRGLGCEKDPVAAIAWFERAAKADNLGAMVDLAFCFRNGTGVTRDDREAFWWAKKAADAGHAAGEVFVGECYMHGYGVTRDLSQAKFWLKRADRQGNARAKDLLKSL